MFSFVETKLFTRLVKDFLKDEEYTHLQKVLMKHPDAGAVIRDSGGLRKLRWAVQGRGKRGGLRVIYQFRHADGIFWMITMYPKNTRDSISGHVLRQIREEIEND